MLYFEHLGFLALHNVFSYYNKDTWRNQNKVINKEKFAYHPFKSVKSKQYNLGSGSSLNY